MERVEPDVMLAQQALIVSQARQQIFLSKPPVSLAGCLLAWLSGTYTVEARECAIALDLALLTQHAGQHTPGLDDGCLFGWRYWRCHGM